MSSDELVSYTDMTSTGTKMSRTNWGDISKYPISPPPEKITGVYNEFLTSVFNRVHARNRRLPRHTATEAAEQRITGERH